MDEAVLYREMPVYRANSDDYAMMNIPYRKLHNVGTQLSQLVKASAL